MARPREDIEREYEGLVRNTTLNDPYFPKKKDQLHLEVLLDIRDFLQKIEERLGVIKWGSKL